MVAIGPGLRSKVRAAILGLSFLNDCEEKVERTKPLVLANATVGGTFSLLGKKLVCVDIFFNFECFLGW